MGGSVNVPATWIQEEAWRKRRTKLVVQRDGEWVWRVRWIRRFQQLRVVPGRWLAVREFPSSAWDAAGRRSQRQWGSSRWYFATGFAAPAVAAPAGRSGRTIWRRGCQRRRS